MMEMVASGSEAVDSVEGGQESDEDIGPSLPPGFSEEVSHQRTIIVSVAQHGDNNAGWHIIVVVIS